MAMDAEDDEEDAQHLQKVYLTDQLQLAKDRGNAEAVELFQKQLAALAPAAEEDRVKDARLLANRLCNRDTHLNTVIAKLQSVAAENRTRLVTLAEEKSKALSIITDE